MAAPSVWGSHLDDGPLRPADINWRRLEQDMRDSDEAVARAAWEPGADQPRPQHADWLRRPRSEDAVIFDEIMGER